MPDNRARAKLARAAMLINARSGHNALPPLILITDDERLADPLPAAYALPRGSMVILRARDVRQRQKLAVALRKIADARHLKLLIANDAELAKRIDADGLHLSQDSAHQVSHWRTLRPDWIITAAAHTLRAALTARGADAVLVSPVFATKSHTDAGSLGVIRFSLIARQIPMPVYALGGIDAANACLFKDVKLAGLAAIGALMPTSEHNSRPNPL